MSISYHRVLQLEKWLASSVCQRYEEDGVVCPAKLRKDLFTVAALDNIDHKSSSNTATQSFHGTSISFMQNISIDRPGIERPPITVPPMRRYGNHDLPDHFAAVPSVDVDLKRVQPKPTQQPIDMTCPDEVIAVFL